MIGRSLLVRLAVITFAATIAMAGSSAMADHANFTYPAAIHAGTCEEPGEEVLALDDLMRLPEGAPEEGDAFGAPGAQLVHGTPEGTEIDLTIDDLVAADHILAVFDAEGTILACGPIGQYTYEDGSAMVFGLRSQGESPYSGIAIVDGDGEGATGIEIYLVNNTPA